MLEDPDRAIAALLERYPDAASVLLHPADAPFFVELCKTLGKLVNFCPGHRLSDVRRWWRSDSLWQAHDARYTADQVCIIPELRRRGHHPRRRAGGRTVRLVRKPRPSPRCWPRCRARTVASRLQVRSDVSGPLGIVLDSPDVLWAGRTATNLVHRLAQPGRLAGSRFRSATKPFHRIPPEVIGPDRAAPRVPLSGTWIDITTLPPTVVDGGAPVVITADAAAAMRAVLAIAAGADSPGGATRPGERIGHRHGGLGTRRRWPTTPVSPPSSARPWPPR